MYAAQPVGPFFRVKIVIIALFGPIQSRVNQRRQTYYQKI